MLNIPGIKGALQPASSSSLSDATTDSAVSEDGTFLRTLESIHQQLPQTASDSSKASPKAGSADAALVADEAEQSGDHGLETVTVNLDLNAANEPVAAPSETSIDAAEPAIQVGADKLIDGQLPLTDAADDAIIKSSQSGIAGDDSAPAVPVAAAQAATDSAQVRAVAQPAVAQSVAAAPNAPPATAQTDESIETGLPQAVASPDSESIAGRAAGAAAELQVSTPAVASDAQSDGQVPRPDITAVAPANPEPAEQSILDGAETATAAVDGAVKQGVNGDLPDQQKASESTAQPPQAGLPGDDVTLSVPVADGTVVDDDPANRAQDAAPVVARPALATELSAIDAPRSNRTAAPGQHSTQEPEVLEPAPAPVFRGRDVPVDEPVQANKNAQPDKPVVADARAAMQQQAEQPAARRVPPPMAPTDSALAPLIADRPALAESVGGLLPTTLAGSLSASAPSAEVAGAHRLVNASVRANINWMIEQGLARATLQLNPAELGALNIKLETIGDQLNVNIHAAQSATRDVLEQTLPRLREHLSQQGFAEVNVSLGNNQQQSAEYSQAQSDVEASRAANDALTGIDEETTQADGTRAARSSHRGMVDVFA